MYLFTRMAQLGNGHYRDGLEWAVTLTEKVNQVVSLDVGLWSPMLSPGLGRLSWGATVESLTDLEDADAKLMADPMYLDMVDKGAALVAGTVDDQTAQFVYIPAETPGAKYVAVVESQIANGQFRRGAEKGVEIAQRVTELGTAPTAFLIGTTGAYGGCAWISAAESLREVEAAEQAVNANPDFMELVDDASSCYLPGVTTQSIWRRIV